MNGRVIFLAGLAASLLAACSSSTDSAPAADAAAAPDKTDAGMSEVMDYDCAGTVLAAAKAAEGDGLEVHTGGTTYNLAHVEADSGAKYADADGNTFWTHGESDAMWTPGGGAEVSCKAGAIAPDSDQVTAFRAADRNQSGLVSFEEFRNYAVGAFLAIDTNQDMTITTDEYAGIHDPVDIKGFNEALFDYFDAYDADSNGSLDLKEWVAVPSADPSKPSPIN